MGLPKFLTGVANFIVLLASVVLLWTGIALSQRNDGVQCFKFLQIALIFLASVLLIVSFLGCFGACCSIPTLLLLYLIFVFLTLLGLIGFTAFAFVVTNKGAGETISGQGFKEYKIGDFSNWLQKQVNDTKNWNTIQSCINISNTCSKLATKYPNETVLYSAQLSPVEAGCCLPPRTCGFTFVNATYFSIPESGPVNTSIADCSMYSNNSTKLCYGCDTCKAGVLKNVQTSWHDVAVISVVSIIVVFLVYWIGCCAYQQARKDSLGYQLGLV